MILQISPVCVHQLRGYINLCVFVFILSISRCEGRCFTKCGQAHPVAEASPASSDQADLFQARDHFLDLTDRSSDFGDQPFLVKVSLRSAKGFNESHELSCPLRQSLIVSWVGNPISGRDRRGPVSPEGSSVEHSLLLQKLLALGVDLAYSTDVYIEVDQRLRTFYSLQRPLLQQWLLLFMGSGYALIYNGVK